MSTVAVGPRRPIAGRGIHRSLAVAVLAGALTAVTAMPAAAGGWWSTPRLEHDLLAIGETATVSADVLFRTVDAAEEAMGSGGYFAYLVRGIDEAGLHAAMSRPGPEDDWWTTPAETVELAPLTLDDRSSNLGGATATFVVPDVAPGLYDLMLCDRGCSQPLADVVPLRDVYVGEPDIVHVLRDVGIDTQHVLDQLGTAGSRLEGLNDRTGTLRGDVDDLAQRLDDLTTANHRLTASLAAVETRVDDTPPPAPLPWWAHAGWFVAGAVAALGWASRRGAQSGDEERGPGRARTRDAADARGEVVPSAPPDLVRFAGDRGTPVR